jgi:hypothetical protein
MNYRSGQASRNGTQGERGDAQSGDAPPNGKPPLPTQVSTTVVVQGITLHLNATVNLRDVPGFATRLRELGCEAPREPIRFDLTPDGKPICPRHMVAMTKHGKGQETWYSHGLKDGDGGQFWCKGYPGNDSQGYWLDLPDPESA